jgi:hypothetical protein
MTICQDATAHLLALIGLFMQQSISGFAILHNVLSYIATVTPEESLFF